MSAERNAPKKGLSPAIRTPIRERGRVKNGRKPETPSSPPTPPAAHAEIRARCHITPRHWITDADLSMDDLNITIYPVQKHTVINAITVSIAVDSNAIDVAKLERNKKVEFAIGALVQAIRNELYLTGSTKTENAMPITKSRDDGRESGKKDEWDRPMAWR